MDGACWSTVSVDLANWDIECSMQTSDCITEARKYFEYNHCLWKKNLRGRESDRVGFELVHKKWKKYWGKLQTYLEEVPSKQNYMFQRQKLMEERQ